MEISDQTEQRAGRGNGWTNGQRSQQSTNKGQRSTTTSIKQTTNTNTKRMQSQGKGQRQRQRRRSKDLLHLHGSIAEFSRYRPRRYGYAYRVTTATAANANKHTNSWFIMLNGFRKEEEGIYYICMHCMHCMHAVLLVILEVRWQWKQQAGESRNQPRCDDAMMRGGGGNFQTPVRT